MKRKHLLLIFALGVISLVGCGPDKKTAENQPQKLDREILGEELAFGRDAAEYNLWNEAIFRWEKVLDSDPDNFNAINNLAVAYETIGNLDRALSLYENALELNEDSTEIRKNYKRFMSFYKKHQRQKARERRAAEARQAEAAQAQNEGEEGGRE